MGLSHRIILPVDAGTGSGFSRQVASRLAIMATILLNLSHNSLEAARGPPRALNNILEHKVRVGDRLRLTCTVESDPPSLVEWHKDGRPIHVGWERFRIARNHSLSISNFSPGDRGHYVCRATNGFGSIEIRHHVQLTWSPSLRNTEEPETYLAPSVGSSLRLLCPLPTGSHGARVTWYKDDVVLSSVFDPEKDDVTNDSSLTLKDVTLADSGVYECREPDGAKEGNVTYVVDVIEDRSKPSFIQAPSNVIASFSGTASFFCHVRSDTVPHIQWLKRVEGAEKKKEEEEEEEKAVLIPSGGGRILHIDQERFQVLSGTKSVSRPDGSYVSKLLIRNVRDQDAGLYLCTCTNNHGYIVSRAYLTVRSEAEDETRYGLTSQHQDLPILSLFAVLTVLAILFLFAILSYAIYRSRFGVKSNTPSSSAIVDHTRRWAALPVDHFRRSTSATLLATPENGRRFEHRYAIVASTLDQHSSIWTPSIPTNLCALRSYSPTHRSTYSPTHGTIYSPTSLIAYSPTPGTTYSPTPGTTYSPTPGTTYSPTPGTTSSPTPRTTYSPTTRTTYSPTHRTVYSPTPETTYSPTPGSTYSPNHETMYSPTSRTTYSPTPRSTYPPNSETTYSLTSGSGYSDCASALGTISEVTSQFGI